MGVIRGIITLGLMAASFGAGVYVQSKFDLADATKKGAEVYQSLKEGFESIGSEETDISQKLEAAQKISSAISGSDDENEQNNSSPKSFNEINDRTSRERLLSDKVDEIISKKRGEDSLANLERNLEDEIRDNSNADSLAVNVDEDEESWLNRTSKSVGENVGNAWRTATNNISNVTDNHFNGFVRGVKKASDFLIRPVEIKDIKFYEIYEPEIDHRFGRFAIYTDHMLGELKNYINNGIFGFFPIATTGKGLIESEGTYYLQVPNGEDTKIQIKGAYLFEDLLVDAIERDEEFLLSGWLGTDLAQEESELVLYVSSYHFQKHDSNGEIISGEYAEGEIENSFRLNGRSKKELYNIDLIHRNAVERQGRYIESDASRKLKGAWNYIAESI